MLKIIILLAIAAFSLWYSPLQAQDRPPIIELLATDPDVRFENFLAALDAAGLIDQVAGLENTTLLVPTDQAFTDVMNYLGVSRQDFLADTATLSQILQLHILPGRYFFRDLSSGVQVNAASNGVVDFTLTGGILRANGARLSDVDNLAGSGVVVHVLDNVLLPAEIIEQAENNRAHFRLAHLAPHRAPLDLYNNGNLGNLQGIAFRQLSEWIEIGAGEQQMAVASAEGDVQASETLTIEPESWITLAVVGSADGQIRLIPLIEDYTPLSLGQAKLSFFNAIDGGSGFDLLANGELFLSNVAFPGTMDENDGFAILPLPTATYDFVVTATNNPGLAVLNVPDIQLRDGFNVFMAAIGTPTNPRVLILETNVNVALALANE